MKTVLIALWCILISGILMAQSDVEDLLLEQFILCNDGDTIDLPSGMIMLRKSLSLEGKSDVVIRGSNLERQQTVLDWSNQIDGAEGIKITNCKNIRLENFTVQNSKGDIIKAQQVHSLIFYKIKAQWTGKPSKKNGGYALYPVQCSYVVLDNCTAIGASDAGIYVGQSDQVVVKNCIAKNNVAGIEIENTTNAVVYNNKAYENTGGILVFDLPGLVKKKGGNVKVYNNEIINNNFKNFAPKGNIVAKVPPGTGVLILATTDVEVFENKIINNNTFSLGIVSYYISEIPIEDLEYNPYPYRILVNDNVFEREKGRPTLKNKMGLLIRLKYGKKTPHIVYDGIVDPSHLDKDGSRLNEYRICLGKNENGTFGNLDAENKFKNLNRDIKPFLCE